MDSRWQSLQELATLQHGHFTTSQAEAVGLTRPAVHYQLRTGRIERSERGVYRFTAYPHTDHEREAVLMLWSRIDPTVAFSHETALKHFELGDAFPEKLHLTVPRTFRMRSPEDVTIHKGVLAESEVHQEGILRFTNPTRTFLDLLLDGYPMEQLQAAYEESAARGLIRRHALEADSEQTIAYLSHVPRARHPELIERLAWATGGS